MIRRLFLGGLIAATTALLPVAASADSCANYSRPAPACGMTCTHPIVAGNWVWLPSIGVPLEAWGFAPPGAEDSVAFGLPGANGNYADGRTSSLQGMSALCSSDKAALFKRQDGAFVIVSSTGDMSGLRGVWSGCE